MNRETNEVVDALWRSENDELKKKNIKKEIIYLMKQLK